MKEFRLFALIVLAVLVVGCTSGSGTVVPGLSIKEFKYSPSEVSGSQKTSLTLVVQNSGGADVKSAYAKIFGFGEDSLFDVTGPCSGGCDATQKTKTNNFNLRAQSSLTGNQGEQKKFVWLMKNIDSIPKDAVRTYTATARVCYPYATTALGKVELISENEWMSRNPIQHEISVTQPTSPVRITVLSKQPIMRSDHVTLDLRIDNVGGGTVASSGYCTSKDATGLNKLKLDIIGITGDVCTASVGDSVFLEQGKSEKVTADCTVGDTSTPISTADVQIKMAYDYYIDSKANIRVKGPNAGAAPSGPGPVTPPVTPTIPITLAGTETMDVGGKALISGCSTADIVDVGVATSPIKRYKFGVKTNNDKIEITYYGDIGTQTATKSAGTPFDIIKNDAHGVRLTYTAAPTCETKITLY